MELKFRLEFIKALITKFATGSIRCCKFAIITKLLRKAFVNKHDYLTRHLN